VEVECVPAPSPKTLVDAVDERDRPTGRVERGRVFEAGANFRTVHVLLFDEVGRLLLQQLGGGRQRHPLRWGSSVAGYLHAGESYQEAAARRVVEELGIEPELEWVGRTAMEDDGVTKFVGMFSGTVAAQDPEIRDLSHVERLRWIRLAGLGRELRETPEVLTPTLRHVFSFWEERGRK
jgi:isopentenyldiphosphate isomerase